MENFPNLATHSSEFLNFSYHVFPFIWVQSCAFSWMQCLLLSLKIFVILKNIFHLFPLLSLFCPCTFPPFKKLFSHLGAFYRSCNDCRPLFMFKSEGHTQKLCVLAWGLLTKSSSNQQELMADSQMAVIYKSFLWDCPASTETSPVICLYQGAGREEGD